MAEVEFIYKGEKVIILCELKENMKTICKRFKEKAIIGNNNIFYSYDGKVGFNEELTFEETANLADKKRKKMSILVFENEIKINDKDIVKSKNVICPECKESIKMYIKGYKLNLFDCKNGHKINNILLNELEKTQMINLKNIKCGICNEKNKYNTYNNEFYKCNECKMNICPLCKTKHNKEHIIINYDKINYLCNKHD